VRTILLKPSHIPTILKLLTEGAKDKAIVLTTVELARKLNKSQQMASKHLEEMENEGLIERVRSRGRTYIRLTEKGASEAARIYSDLDAVFGKGERTLEAEGSVFEGLGEGAYYVSLSGYKRQFVSKLGFEPFPGTLNLRLGTPVDRKVRRDLAVEKGIHIEGFKDGKRTYGGAECFRSLVNGKIWCAVLVIERTSYDDSVLEIIAPTNLRKALHLGKGSKVRVKVFLGESGPI
jgi:riboflavin kinase, archaea type